MCRSVSYTHLDVYKRQQIHKTAPDFDTILFSGGKIGFQVEIPFEDFKKVINVNTADIIVEAV